MNFKSVYIQDSTSSSDTVIGDTSKIIKATKLMPSIPSKIASEEGAIIPKEAIEMVSLQPSMPYKESKESCGSACYIMGGITIIVLIACTILILKKIKGNSSKSSN